MCLPYPSLRSTHGAAVKSLRMMAPKLIYIGTDWSISQRENCKAGNNKHVVSMSSFIQRKTLLRKSNAWIMRLESYDISPVKMDNVLGEGMEMVYKLIRTRTTPVSQLTNTQTRSWEALWRSSRRYFSWNRQVHQLAREVKLG